MSCYNIIMQPPLLTVQALAQKSRFCMKTLSNEHGRRQLTISAVTISSP